MFTTLRTRVLAGLVVALVTPVTFAASVIDPLVLTSVTTDISDTGTAMFDGMLPIVAVILTLGIGIKLFKRFANKV